MNNTKNTKRYPLSHQIIPRRFTSTTLVLLFSLFIMNSAIAHNKVVVVPLQGDDKLLTGRLASDSPDDGDYYASDHTVIDHITGLEWQRYDDNDWKPWATAVGYCGAISSGGHHDWRLPSISELISIIDFEVNVGSHINASAFPTAKVSDYWSATAHTSNNGSAWLVDFETGKPYVHLKGFYFYVRCVRNTS